jgi:hypothetical protein
MIYSSHQQEFYIIILQIETNYIHHINMNFIETSWANQQTLYMRSKGTTKQITTQASNIVQAKLPEQQSNITT